MIERTFPDGGLSLTPTLSRWERESSTQRWLRSGALDLRAKLAPVTPSPSGRGLG